MDDDQSRHVATSPDKDFTLSIDEALGLYARAGLPRTPRSVQRYCAKGHLDCRRVETAFGEKYLISPDSVAKHIAYIEEVRPLATSRDVPRQAATDIAPDNRRGKDHHESPTSPDLSRPVAAAYVERLEGENEFLRKQIDVKDGQLAVRDKTIEAMLERDRESNILASQLQKMLAPLLPQSPEPPPANADRP
jgi:hypothetical protein